MSDLTQLKSSQLKALREELYKEQGNICLILKEHTENQVLDHCHTKGTCRGVIDREINVFLGKIENNCKRYKVQPEDLPRILRNIADYLEKDHLPLIHPTEAPKIPKLKKASYNKLKKEYKGKAKFPEYPKTGKITKVLEKLFAEYMITPEFCK